VTTWPARDQLGPYPPQEPPVQVQGNGFPQIGRIASDQNGNRSCVVLGELRTADDLKVTHGET
jgi:hypothetical protein